jgi:phospholipid transport system substrate-binding protein
MVRMRKLFTALAATLLLASWGAHAQLLAPVPARPDAMMSALTAEVMAVLGQDAGAGRAAELARLVERRIVPVFDFQRMTRIALARNWRAATAEQQDALAAQFKTLLVRTYSQALLEFRGQAIDYKPLRAAAGDTEVTVRSAMRRPGVEPLTIDYDMADNVAGWQVYDVKIAGVSLVLAYRESFASVVRSSGIEGLVRMLEDKNRQNERGASAIDAAALVPVLLIYGGARAPTP